MVENTYIHMCYYTNYYYWLLFFTTDMYSLWTAWRMSNPLTSDFVITQCKLFSVFFEFTIVWNCIYKLNCINNRRFYNLNNLLQQLHFQFPNVSNVSNWEKLENLHMSDIKKKFALNTYVYRIDRRALKPFVMLFN